MSSAFPDELAFFNLVADLSSEFAQASGVEIDLVIEQALAKIGQFYAADRCYLFRFSDDLSLASNTHEWCAMGVSAQMPHLQQLKSADFGDWFVNWHQGNPSIINDVSAFPAASPEYQLLAAQDIKSLIMLPIRSKSRLIGMFGIDIVRSTIQWPAEHIAGLQLVAGNICGALMRQQIERQTEQLTFFDPLTGLANRQLMLKRIAQAQLHSSRCQQYAALLFVDIDDFKTLNDSLGYNMGDKVLTLVAGELSAAIPYGDTVGRLNADEFLILIEMLDSDEAKAVKAVTNLVERLQLRVADNVALKQVRPKNTLSIGATLFQGDSTDVDVLITQADMAMYQVKQNTGNGLVFFDAQLQQQAKRRILLALELRDAIAEQQFELFYQPQLVHPGIVVGAESLVRWRHPTRGLLGPSDFLDFAEESGLILAIGEIVLRLACQQLAVWQSNVATARLELSVNISAQQFRQRDFVAMIQHILAETAADATTLKLELTESMLVDDFANVVDKMRQLQQLGIRFSLDDFGTGYSSLVYLKRLPLYQLKIDRGFVEDLLSDENEQAIVRTIILLGQTLGLEVLAEGVESAGQLNALLKLGCYHYQGYFFAKPLPVKDFEQFLQQHNNKMFR
ncbi:sensor domain-containing phosphodiesterase [Alishewanella sp. d11]|uniref:sensor domain-containing phosphodiesterase n=1 Tax=Alishewanella sp. d11 TaxID=3414030 RepID=UPI003BF8F95D